MKKILLFLLPLGFFWNCFTITVSAKHARSLADQRGRLSYLQESIREIKQLSRSETELKVIYDAAIYTNLDSKDRYIIQKASCFRLKNLTYGITYYEKTDTDSYQTCDPSDFSKSADLKLEEIPELRNKIWIPDLGIVLYSKKGFDKFTLPFPHPEQLKKPYYYPRINSLKYIKGREVISASLFEGKHYGHRYLRLRLETKEEIYFYATGSGFKLRANDSGVPIKNPLAQDDMSKEEQLEIEKLDFSNQDKLIAVQSEYPDETGIFRIENKVYRVLGQVQDFRNGVLFVFQPYDLRKREDDSGIWSAYAVLYPFSITLDIVTSPIQAVSILILGFSNHLYLWGCMLGGKCFSPLG